MTYAKAVGAVVVAVLTFLVTALTDGISQEEWILVAGILVAAVGTYIVPNLEAGIARYAKAVVAALTAGLTVLATVILGGLTNVELIEVLLASLAAVGVVAGVPNREEPSSATVHRPAAGF